MFEIRFTRSAEKEWFGLDSSIRALLTTKLERARAQEAPRVRLKGYGGSLYKLKLTSPQFRVVYRLDEDTNQLIVIAVGHRDNVYQQLSAGF